MEVHRRSIGGPSEVHQRSIGGPSEVHRRSIRGSSEVHQRSIGGPSEVHQRSMRGLAEVNQRSSEVYWRSIGGPSEVHRRSVRGSYTYIFVYVYIAKEIFYVRLNLIFSSFPPFLDLYFSFFSFCFSFILIFPLAAYFPPTNISHYIHPCNLVLHYPVTLVPDS